MESTIETLPKSTVKLSVTIPGSEMGKYLDAAAQEVAGQTEIKGFRKGKAPRKVVEQKFGKDQVAHRAMEIAIADGYYHAVLKHDVKPIGRPETDYQHEHADLEQTGISFTATVPVVPEVTLGDYSKVKVKPVKSEYSEKQVDETIEQLRQSRASFAQVSRAAKQGDRVEIDFVGKMDGKEFEGGKSENHPLVIGDGSFIPGFEDELVGLAAGGVKTFTVTFPKDYGQKDLAGKPAEFTVTMKQVQETTLPKVDDEFAKGFGAASLEDFKKRLAENLKQEKDAEAARQTEMQVVEAVMKQAKVEIPPALVNEELDGMMAELRQQIERQGLPYDKYLEHLKKTEEDLRKEHRDEAERRVKMSLVLNEVQRQEKLEPKSADIEAEIKRQLEAVESVDDKERVKSAEFRQYVTRVLGNRLAVNRLMQTAGQKQE